MFRIFSYIYRRPALLVPIIIAINAVEYIHFKKAEQKMEAQIIKDWVALQKKNFSTTTTFNTSPRSSDEVRES